MTKTSWKGKNGAGGLARLRVSYKDLSSKQGLLALGQTSGSEEQKRERPTHVGTTDEGTKATWGERTVFYNRCCWNN